MNPTCIQNETNTYKENAKGLTKHPNYNYRFDFL